jgi:hypothetical protein
MSSLFHLKTSIDECDSSNHGILKQSMRQVTATRDVTTNFSSGLQNYKWELGGSKWWVPSKSYFRIRASLTKANGTALVMADDIAPAYGLCGNLFQSLDFKMADTTVCRIDRNVAQVDILNNRLTKSRSWNKSVGYSTNFYEQDFASRQALVCSDGLNLSISPEQSPSSITLADLGITDGKASSSVSSIGGVIAIESNTDTPDDATRIQIGDVLFIETENIEVRSVVTAVAYLNKKNILIGVDEKTTEEVKAPITRFTLVRNQLDVSLSTVPSRQAPSFEMIWKPPLGVFDIESALPCGKYELVCNPNQLQTLNTSVVESQKVAKTAGTDYKFSIVSCELYICEMEGERVDNSSYLFDFNTLRVQSMDIKSNSFGQRTFDVSPSTRNLVVAFQDGRVGTNTKFSPSKFRSYVDAVADIALKSSDQGLTLSRQYVNYSGQSRPSPDSNPEVSSTVDYTTQGYIDSLLDAGALNDNGGCETVEEWQQAGAYYNMLFYREKTDMSTRVTVNSGFQGDVTNMRCLLFDNASQVCSVKISNSAIVDVSVADL